MPKGFHPICEVEVIEVFTDRHAAKVRGDLSCFIRVIIFASGMTGFLRSQNIRIFDYSRWAEPFREEIRTNAERLAEANGLQIEFIRKNNFRDEARIKEVLAKPGDRPGLIHIFSAMEPCASYQPWHDRKTGNTYLQLKT